MLLVEHTLGTYSCCSSLHISNTFDRLFLSWPGASATSQTASGSSLLIEAAKNGDIDCLHVLISTGKVDINGVDYEGNTALHYAQSNHDPQAALAASWLKAHGANSKKKNMYGLTPSDGRELDRGGYYSNTF